MRESGLSRTAAVQRYNSRCEWYFEGGRSMSQSPDIQQILSSEDPQFREWIEEHHQCEARLSELSSKKEVSTDEELEEKTLKKRKLHLKDQMTDRIRSYEMQNATA
jgi:uncharacterized protein YdcH (DUF465 family)